MDLTRKDFLKSTGALGAAAVLGSCGQTQRELDVNKDKDALLKVRRYKKDRGSSVDLSSGEPDFMQAFWVKENQKVLLKDLELDSYAKKTPEKLLEDIKEIHRKFGRTIAKEEKLVFGCGAMAVILASITALAKKTGADTVFAQAPYFYILKNMVESLPGMRFTSNPDEIVANNTIQYICMNNSPDGRYLDRPMAKYIILDRAYDDFAKRAPAFWSGAADITVFSAGKNHYMPGIRFGYGYGFDNELLEVVERHILFHTLGYPAMAAGLFVELVNSRLENDPDFYQRVEKIKDERREKLIRAIRKFNKIKNRKIIVADSKNSDYLWADAGMGANAVEIFAKQGIRVKSGSVFGADESFCRLSITADEETFQEGIKRLAAV